MAEVTGIVDNVSIVKQVKTRFNPNAPIWGITLTDGRVYEAGFNKPKVEAGSSVEFDLDPKWKNQIQDGTLKVDGATPEPPKKSGGTKSGGYSGGSKKESKPFPVPPTHGDRSIIRQNALTNARSMVTDLVVSEHYKDGSFDLDRVSDEILEVARKFEEYSAGDIERRAAEAKMKGEDSDG